MARTLTIATWNVNSIKARLDAATAWLAAAGPDLLALQEIKTVADDFPYAAFEALGYRAAVHGQKTYNGVALLSREPLDNVRRGIPEHAGDPQSRVIEGTLHGVTVMNLYVPNGQEPGSEKFAYKLGWLDALARHLEGRAAERLVLVGDFNIAPEARDVYDAAAFEGQVLFTLEERAALARITALGFVDLFRRFHDEPKAFTWWDYRMNAFRRNMGARIDHLLAGASLAGDARDCVIDKEPRRCEKPSDHAPVVATFEIE